MDFVLTLREGLRRHNERAKPEEQLKLEQVQSGASGFVVPLEYETLGRILCPNCLGHEWDTLICESLARHAQMDWPYLGPGGDRHHCECKKCRHAITVTFWFTR